MSDSEEIVLSQLPKPQNGSLEIKDETEEAPLASLNGSPKKKRKSTSKENGSSSKKKKTSKKKQKTTKVKEDPEIKSETTDVEPVAKDSDRKASKKSTATPREDTETPKPETSLEPETPKKDSQEAEDYKWWEDEKFGEGPDRWQTLEHNGVIFPPPYKPLPSYVKLYYDSKPVNLPLAAEEVAGFFAEMLETDHAKNPVFQKNFFEDFLQVLRENGGCDVDITEFDKCDFSKMHAHFVKVREEKKNMSKAEKLRLKQEREALEEPYRTCLLNGRRENVGNFKVEPPSLFRGRGAHPKTGKLKKRVYPEDITLNLGIEAPIPPAPEGHKWGEIRHDKSVVWLAMWKENISDSFKYVKLAANSSIKGISDMKKFETARRLKDHIERIRDDYKKMLKDPFMQNRQIATATYLIDVFALRAGGEKGEDEADTVGCCSLRYEHVTLRPPNTVIFDFLGKDSIRFYQEVEVDRQVFKNLRIFKKEPKQPGDDLFDRITPATLNKHLQAYMKGLTAKVFRTYNASKTMQDQMDLIPNEGTVAEKVMKYNAANRTVAILCNHQRTVSKAHQNSVGKIQEKIKEMEWQKIRLKKMILVLDSSQKAKNPKYFEELEDMTSEDQLMVVTQMIERQREQAKRKWTRDNEKRAMEKQELLTEEDLQEKLSKIKASEEEYRHEIESGEVEVTKGASVEKLKVQIEKIENRILNTNFQLKDKEDNSEVSLGTSKLNYIDPRLTVMFAKKFNVPIEKLFTKTLREKFTWAIESADENWRF
ncbi:putative DNA topoisomerase [Clavispora lusitaniae]|uniref:DNA topoisomerase I n=1 Tax=Clavispora lusitaniae TaxID=36911 RepID=A0AA91T2H3_CLALS|nr:putative DNA topoisomerase [Clavispora lusitaniae]